MIYATVHLVDDLTAGGVTRLLNHLANGAASGHRIVAIERGRLPAPKLEADVIVSNLSVCWRNFPLFVALRAAYPRTPLVHVEHSYSESFVAAHVESRDRFDTLFGAVYSLFDVVVAVSPEQRRWLARRHFCRPGKLRLIEPCADLAPFLAVAPRAAGRPRVVGALGRFDRQKGFDVLIDAFRSGRLPNHEQHLWGAGAEESMLRARAVGLPNVAFMGFAENPAAAMARCDCVAMPSRWEPHEMVAIEAMAAGRAVLCARVDGLRDHIAAGAIAVAQNAPAEWAARLADLSEEDLARAATLGRSRAAATSGGLRESWRELVAELTATSSNRGAPDRAAPLGQARRGAICASASAILSRPTGFER